MKQVVLCCLLMLCLLSTVGIAGEHKMLPRYNRITNEWTSYPVVTLREIQEVPLDSLLVADGIQNSNHSRYTLQASPYEFDTVTVTALCVVPSGVLNFTQSGYTMLLYDTAAGYSPWGGVFVRATDDSAAHGLDGFFNVERGDIIEMTGLVSEFPAANMNSVTQFQPIPGIAVTILSESNPIPPPIPLSVSDFYSGLALGGTIKYSTGEQYEDIIVELTGVVVNSHLNSVRGTFNAVQSGNMISDYDASTWFTIRGPDPITGFVFRHPDATYTLPGLNTVIDTLRGYITTVSGGENPRGYRIAPVYDGVPEDHYILGNSLPLLSDASRPYQVESSVAPEVSVRVTQGTFPITSVNLKYSINWGPFSTLGMVLDNADTLYKATIPAQSEDTFVHYFIEATDANSNVVTLASHASGGAGQDTSKGFFFYVVRDGNPSIYDVQYTPFVNGYSSYAGDYPDGGVVYVSGVVTVDTSEMFTFPRSTVGGAYAYYMQTGNSPWNGIWITGPDSVMGGLTKGDSVTVRGTVQEWPSFNQNVTTKIGSIDSVLVHSTGNPIPEAILKSTEDFGSSVSNGSPLAEPYEGMLVKFQNVTVTNVWPYFADNSQYEIDNGSGGVWVHRDGNNTYSNIPAEAELGYTILYVGNIIGEVTGIIHFSVNRYKFVPLSNSAFKNVGSPFTVSDKWNMLSFADTGNAYTIPTLYPNKTSNAFRFIPGSGYEAIPDTEQLQMGYGFWLKFGAPDTIYKPGLKVLSATIPAEEGWNLVGTISEDVDANMVTSDPEGLIASQFFGYNNGYIEASTLKPGKAYWVKTSGAGNLIMNSTFSFAPKAAVRNDLERFYALRIADNNGGRQTLYVGKNEKEKLQLERYEMPPPPPSDIFTARFASQRMVEAYPSEIKEEVQYPIELTSVKYPLTITMDAVYLDPNVAISVKTNDGKSYPLEVGTTVTLKDVKNGKLVLTVNKGNLPKEFSLSQNFPNPFNPTTNFTVAVPQDGNVEIIVYDILGRTVRTLSNGEMTAGYHTVEWNGLTEHFTPVGSGVYFVRMKSGTFTSVRKIMMMK
jgi:hypothetical protein